MLHSDSRPTRSMAYVGLGDIQANRPNRGMQAVEQYRMAIRVDPSNLEAYHRAAQVSIEMGYPDSYRNASEFLLEVICLDPSYEGAYETWHDRILDKRRDEMRRVNGCLAGYLENHPEDSRWLLDMAEYYYQLEEIDSSLETLDNLQDAEPDYRLPDRHLLRARCLLELDDSLGFEDEYWQAVDAAEQDGDFARLAAHAEAIFRPDESQFIDSLDTTGEWALFFRVFWAQRDPDPFTPHNERLVEHYRRLRHASLTWPLNDVYSGTRTSENLYRMEAFRSGSVGLGLAEYDPMVFFNRCPELALQERGMLYIRHGQPDLINREMYTNAQGVAEQVEVWHYGGILFPWQEGKMSIGDYRFIPAGFNVRIADMEKAMEGETFDDPLPRLSHDCCAVAFMAPGKGSLFESYHAISVEETGQSQPPVASVAVFDREWREKGRAGSPSWRVSSGGEDVWLGVNQVVTQSGLVFLASRFDVPGRRAVERQETWIKTFHRDTLELSGVLLGSPVQPGTEAHIRHGIELLPRPSLTFTAGEIMTVYLEIYGLVTGQNGTGGFTEQVTVTRTRESGGVMDKIKRLFTSGGQERSGSLTLTFEREVELVEQTIPETFTVDTSLLLPGEYRMTVAIDDASNGSVRRAGCGFELMEPK